MLEAVGEVFPEAKYQRCTVHFYAGLCPATPCSWYPMGQQEVYEYEAPGGGP